MRRIWQLLTLYLIGEEGKIDFEMSEFQRLSVSIPQSFWEGDRVSRSSSTEQGWDAVKVKIGRKGPEDKSQGRQSDPRGGEHPSLCGLRSCSVLDSFPTMPRTRKQETDSPKA